MKKKSLFLVISLLLVIIAVVVCFNLNKTTNKNKENDLIISDIRNNDHIQLSMQKLSNDISGVTVQATVNPSSVADNTLNWTLSWKTTNSNNVNDYVSMQVSADTQSVTLTYIKQFDTQIVLKATSTLTPGVSAQCSIENKYNSNTIESLSYTYQLINFDISDGLSVNSINLNKSTIIF